MTRMRWDKLLNPKRVGELLGKRPSEPDSRTPFERDYGRAVFCTPVRRLQDKTQVFPLEEHDAVRTRLTHSMEVSSVARNLGKEIAQWLLEKRELKQSDVYDIETIAATCGLVHDLGNPPFGHAGEVAIQTWFRKKLESEEAMRLQEILDENTCIFSGIPTAGGGPYKNQLTCDFLNFEGNAQTLRLLSKLQVLASAYGLNMTCATFSAACKYVAPSHTLDSRHQSKKPGFFYSEQNLISLVRDEVGTQNQRNPITYLVEACDDMVYSTGDLEDAVKKGLFTWHFLKSELQEKGRNNKTISEVIAAAEKKVADSTSKGKAKDEEVAQAFRTFAISAIKESVLKTFQTRYDAIMNGEYGEELTQDELCGAAALVKACKKIGAQHVYPSSNTIKLEIMGRRIIHDLMDILWEGAAICGNRENEPDECRKGFPGRAYSLISSNYKQVFLSGLKDDLPERYCRLQMVTDQIAGMTDSYAANLHRKLTNGD